MSKVSMPRVLLLDDDSQIRQLLTQLLNQSGFAVTSVATVAEFHRALSNVGVDVCIIDWMLMGESGLTLATQLAQQTNRPPMLMLSANATLDERLQGLSVVDDYVTKPFEPKELIARLHALLRRFQSDKTEQHLVLGKLQLDVKQHEVSVSGQPIALTSGEWQLLWYLAQRPGRLVTREQLLSVLDDAEAGDRAVDIRISRLRKKLADAPYIETVWGQGYRFHINDAEV